MNVPANLDWNLTPQEAIAQQRVLAARVRAENDFGAMRYAKSTAMARGMCHTFSVAGVDVGFEEHNTISRAAAVVLALPELTPIEAAVARRAVTFPYIPGLLAFRELPVIFDALAQLKREPDLIIVDGHGRAHPRRFGIASHLGVLLDCASIGCAKSILVGHAEAPENRVGAWTPLVDRGETIGAAVRTRVNVTPLYVSVGHRVDLPTALELVLQCCKGYRLPETTRYAHRAAGGL